MKARIAFSVIPLLLATAAPSLRAEPPGPWDARPAIEGTPASHILSWESRINFKYRVEWSLDLETWQDIPIIKDGTDKRIPLPLMPDPPPPEIFYRVVESPDPDNGGFLSLPGNYDKFDPGDGVYFAFNLNVKDAFLDDDVFPVLPAKIRIWKRPAGAPDWTLIGTLAGTAADQYTVDDQAGIPTIVIKNDFAERNGTGFKFVRGSAVWLPDALGTYDVKAEAISPSGETMARATRKIFVGEGSPPAIEITGIILEDNSVMPGPFTSQQHVAAKFETSVSTSPGGPAIWRVEFHDDVTDAGNDNGELVGYDYTAPYGDEIEDLEGNQYMLTRETHNITAKAIDLKGFSGITTSPFVAEITGGNARPSFLGISHKINGVPEGKIQPGQTITVRKGDEITLYCVFNDADGIETIESLHASWIKPYTAQEIASNYSYKPKQLVLGISNLDPGSHTIKVTAEDSDDPSYPFYFTLFLDKAGSGTSFPEDLVANIVEETSANPVSGSARFTGIVESSGEFPSVMLDEFGNPVHDEEGQPVFYAPGTQVGLEFDEGIVLTTGEFALWNGGNNDPDITGDRTDTVGDEEIDRWLAPDPEAPPSWDAAVLEFDVQCVNGQLELEFQFGSEEYLEYVENFNDAFLVTIDGVPVSVTTDASGIVSVNSAHPFIPAGTLTNSYVDAPEACEHLYLNNLKDRTELPPNGTDEIGVLVAAGLKDEMVEYDGLTVRLRIHAFVTPGTTHHVRIAIADLKDEAWDSGLFVRKDSVRTIEPQP